MHTTPLTDHYDRSAKPAERFILIEVAKDEHTQKAIETVLFDRRIRGDRMAMTPPRIPAPGNVIYRIFYNDAEQLFWLGTAFQSQLSQ